MEAGGGVGDSLLAGACVFFTLCMFSSGLSDFRHIWKTRSVEHVQFLPFLTTDINTLSWLSYGALKGDWTVIVVNAVGTALQTLYVLMYLHFCPRKRTVLLQTVTLLGFSLLAFSYFWLLVPEEEQLQQLGLFCCVCTIFMYLSPMAGLAKIIHTKSTQGLSWPLTIASLLSSASWTYYGLHFQDPYITVPNFPGILTSLLRLWLFWKYPQDRDRSYELLQS
ncbi:sugar transporter SWEET1 isoform X2 [Suncus etruscus]|uniref:sugar transporter SWEET1 isoform X2 n=1 Tax=Suncus etruscus TaxID=109475 RepID=UPI00210F9F38|nr:sugar transporter SWEET1 isoform X2 [Suncus etruscus]